MLFRSVALMYLDKINTVTLVMWYFVQLLCFYYLKIMAQQKFGGMSGDLAGWFLQMCEVLQLAAVVVGTYWRVG